MEPADLMLGLLCCLVYNANRDEDSTPWKLERLFPSLADQPWRDEEEERQQALERVRAKSAAMAEAFGARLSSEAYRRLAGVKG